MDSAYLKVKRAEKHYAELAQMFKKKKPFESPRVHRRPVCLSQATLPDSFKLS